MRRRPRAPFSRWTNFARSRSAFSRDSRARRVLPPFAWLWARRTLARAPPSSVSRRLSRSDDGLTCCSTRSASAWMRHARSSNDPAAPHTGIVVLVVVVVDVVVGAVVEVVVDDVVDDVVVEVVVGAVVVVVEDVVVVVGWEVVVVDVVDVL